MLKPGAHTLDKARDRIDQTVALRNAHVSCIGRLTVQEQGIKTEFYCSACE